MPRFLTIRAMWGVLALGTVGPVALDAAAQDRSAAAVDSSGVTARVTYLASATVYLDAGRDQGIHQRDTLDVSAGGRGLGRLLVTGTARARSVATFAGAPFDVAVGDTLVLRVAGRAPPSPDGLSSGGAVADSTAGAGRPSILAAETRSGRADVRTRRPVRISGRIRVSVSGRRTATGSGLFDPSARTIASPTVAIRLAAADLPGGWDAVLDARLSRRFSSNSIVGSDGQARIYRLSLARSGFGSPLDVEAGRFPLRQDGGHAYWDGVRGGYRGRQVSAGVAFGMEPDAFNGSVQTDVPKAAAYAGLSLRPGAWRLSTIVSAVHVRPSNGWLEHTYVGVEQDISLGLARASADLLVDRDPEGDGWSATRISLRASVPIAAGLTLTGRHHERRPYAWWRTADVLGTRRRRESLGLTWNRSGASAGVTWSVNTAEAYARSTSWMGSFRVSRTPAWGLGIAASASQWSRIGNTSRLFSLAVMRALGTGRVEVMWRHYAFDSGIGESRSQSLRLLVLAPLTRRLRLDASSQVLFGDVAAGLAFSLGLTATF